MAREGRVSRVRPRVNANSINRKRLSAVDAWACKVDYRDGHACTRVRRHRSRDDPPFSHLPLHLRPRSSEWKPDGNERANCLDPCLNWPETAIA